MREILEEKVAKDDLRFTDAEVQWLLEHIGDFDPTIRDDLVFNALAGAILNDTLTTAQFQWLVQKTITKDLIFYHLNEGLPATVTRTFAALLNGFLIQADGNSEGRYYHLLTEDERTYFFERALAYLNKETDYTGYSQQFGWVHGLAHGADFLAKASLHENFPAEKMPALLQALQHVFKTTEKLFHYSEERRLAVVIYELVKADKLDLDLFCQWLLTNDFSNGTLLDCDRLANFENFLAAIYFHLESAGKLPDQLKTALLQILKDY